MPRANLASFLASDWLSYIATSWLGAHLMLPDSLQMCLHAGEIILKVCMGIFKFEKDEFLETHTHIRVDKTMGGQNSGRAHLRGGQTFENRLPHNVRHLGNVFYRCLRFQRKYLATCADLSA